MSKEEEKLRVKLRIELTTVFLRKGKDWAGATTIQKTEDELMIKRR